jgi:hypothetical protein
MIYSSKLLYPYFLNTMELARARLVFLSPRKCSVEEFTALQIEVER